MTMGLAAVTGGGVEAAAVGRSRAAVLPSRHCRRRTAASAVAAASGGGPAGRAGSCRAAGLSRHAGAGAGPGPGSQEAAAAHPLLAPIPPRRSLDDCCIPTGVLARPRRQQCVALQVTLHK